MHAEVGLGPAIAAKLASLSHSHRHPAICGPLCQGVTGPTAALEGEQANRRAPSSDDMRPAFPALVLGSTHPAELRRVVANHDDLLVLVWHRNDGEFLSHQTPNLVSGV